MALASGVLAQSITPENYEATIKVGETITISKTITLPESGATAYSQIVDLTSDKSAVQTDINSLSACMFSCGGDGPEAN